MTVPTSVTNFTLHGGDPQVALRLAAYLKNKFSFVGIQTPERRRQAQALQQASKSFSLPDLRGSIAALYRRDERDYQYVAIDMALINVSRFEPADILWLRQFITSKSWWDSVDGWRKVITDYIHLHPQEKRQLFDIFVGSPNFWERRVAITLQLPEKETVEPELLRQAITADLATKEFFIQKAIGWALRQYSKTNAAWVTDFIAAHERELSPLARREGFRYLRQQSLKK